VYGHWREEAHRNETLRADTFANVWEWMFRLRMEEAKDDDDRPDTMETIEAFAMNLTRKKRRNGTDGSLGECPAPSSGAAARGASASSPSTTPASPRIGRDSGTDDAKRKQQQLHEFFLLKADDGGGASSCASPLATTGTKSPRLIDHEGNRRASPSSSFGIVIDESSPGGAEPIQVPESAPAAHHPENGDRLSSPASRLEREDRLRAVHERRLAGERTVRILATKRAEQLRNECESLTHRITQLEEENAGLRESLKRANVMLADQVRDPVRERSSDDECASIKHRVAPLEEENVTLYDIFENAGLMMVDPVREPVQERDARGSTASSADAETGGSAFGGALSTCPGPVFQQQNPWFSTRPSGPQPMDFTQGGFAGGSALVYWPPAAYYAPARPPMPVGAYNVSAAPASFETRTYYAPLAGAYEPYAVRNPQDPLRAELLAWQTAHHDLRCAYSGAEYELDGVRAQLSQARDALGRAGAENRLLQSRVNDLEDKRRKMDATVLRLTETKRAMPIEFQDVETLRAQLAAKDSDLERSHASLDELRALNAKLQKLVDGPVRAGRPANAVQVEREKEHRAATLHARDLEQQHQGTKQQIQRLEQEIQNKEQPSEIRLGRTSFECEEAERGRSNVGLVETNDDREQLAAPNQVLQERVRNLEGEVAQVNKALNTHQLGSLRRFTGCGASTPCASQCAAVSASSKSSVKSIAPALVHPSINLNYVYMPEAIPVSSFYV
jgi:predicted  nucleic acid-binding Zn-ribbon protein